MGDRKFNTNAEQIRAESVAIANSNAPQGTPTEFILVEAMKIEEFITNGPTDFVRQVALVKRLRQEKEVQEEQKRLEREVAERGEEAQEKLDYDADPEAKRQAAIDKADLDSIPVTEEEDDR